MKDNIFTTSFTESFIDKLADYLEENYLSRGKGLDRVAICFGGKRPALFIKRELAKRIGRGFTPPRIFTIDEFVSYIVRKKVKFESPQDLNTNYTLYKLAEQLTPEILKGRETFAQFLPWTREIIKFIDHLDLENIEQKSLMNIKANAKIGYDVPKDINQLLQSMVVLRDAYHEQIEKQKSYPRGYQYIKAANFIDEVTLDEFDNIIFANFFYFNASEQKIVKKLYERKKATLIFQGDQRKWPVLERISKSFGCNIVEGEQPDQTHFNLKTYSGFDQHSQIGLVKDIIKNIKDIEDTVIVLPNTDTLIPLLSELTTSVKEFNISCGYPLKRSSLYNLFELLFKAQLTKRNGEYYTKDYLKVIRHPFVKNLKLTEHPAVTRILIHKIEEILIGKEKLEISGRIFLSLSEIEEASEVYDLAKELLERLNIDVDVDGLKEVFKNIHQALFTDWEDVYTFSSFATCLEQTLELFIDKSFLKNYPLNLNIATKIFDVKDEFKTTGFKDEQFPQEELFKIFESKITHEKVSFIGSPLKGLQILGLFETRSLNFKNVIILDVNEGALPKLNIYEPLIPREVMICLNLDRLELEEEVQRYQFMRLISSAENVHLVYQESKDKEKSRFIEELLWEQEKKENKLDIIRPLRSGYKVKVEQHVEEIYKTDEMISFLKQMSYSPSSVNTYLRNPMDFYYNYVLGLQEKDDVLDEPEARHIGTFIHEVLEEAYQPFLNKKPIYDEKFKSRFEKVFDKHFNHTLARSLKSDAFLLKSVIEERLQRFFQNEAKSPERQINRILHLESRFEDTLKLSCGDIKFRYIVDRVDECADGSIMIVDYKTGSVDQMPKALNYLEKMDLNRESIFENVRSFQIPLYFQLLKNRFEGKKINAGLYSLRTLKFNQFLHPDRDVKIEELNKIFTQSLDFVLNEILDPKVPFVNQPDI